MNIALHIEALRLPAGMAVDQTALIAAIAQALARLIAERGLPPVLQANGSIAQMAGGTYELGANSSVEALGIQVAQALYAR
jgi:hypothetical protein